MEESRRDAYRRIEEAAARRVASWPAWKQNATQVPIERHEGEPESHLDDGQIHAGCGCVSCHNLRLAQEIPDLAKIAARATREGHRLLIDREPLTGRPLIDREPGSGHPLIDMEPPRGR